MFKDEIAAIMRWYKLFLTDEAKFELKGHNRVVIVGHLLWSVVFSDIFFGSFLMTPLTLVLLWPCLFFLFDYVKICKIIKIQDITKYYFELIASLIQGGQVIDQAILLAIEKLSQDRSLPKSLHELMAVNKEKIVLNLGTKYSLVALGDYSGLKSIAASDWICQHCVETGLDLDVIYLQFARNLGRQQIYRRELLHQLTSKQQEFGLMILAPLFVSLCTRAMMPDYFVIKGHWLTSVVLGVCLSSLYSAACCLYLYTHNQMLRGTYDQF